MDAEMTQMIDIFQSLTEVVDVYKSIDGEKLDFYKFLCDQLHVNVKIKLVEIHKNIKQLLNSVKSLTQGALLPGGNPQKIKKKCWEYIKKLTDLEVNIPEFIKVIAK